MRSSTAGLLIAKGPTVRTTSRSTLLGWLAGSVKRRSRRLADGMFASTDAPCRSSVAFDIVAFGTRCPDDEVQVFVHRSLYDILELSFDQAGIGWHSVQREDRGDGALVVLPAGKPPELLVGPLVLALATFLRRYNKLVSDAAQIRLRMAVHSGPVYSDANGVVGRSLVHLFRMLEAPTFKDAMKVSEAALGVVASERLYRDVIEPAEDVLSIGPFEPIEVDVKETHSPAWMAMHGDQPTEALLGLSKTA